MLPDIKTILYASDMGSQMRPAFRFALSLALRYDARLVMLHVLEPIADTSKAMIKDYLDQTQLQQMQEQGYQRVRNEMQSRLQQFYQDEKLLTDEMKLPELSVDVMSGLPAETIVSEATRLEAKLIVMGSHTDHTLGHRLMGSVARKVIHSSKVPVLIVPFAEKQT